MPDETLEPTADLHAALAETDVQLVRPARATMDAGEDPLHLLPLLDVAVDASRDMGLHGRI